MNTNKVIPFVLTVLLTLCSTIYSTFAFSNTLQGENTHQDKSVSILQMVEHPAINATCQGIIDELKEHGILISSQSAQGNIHLVTQIAQQYVGNHPNVLVGIGTTASQSLMAANHTAHIPIVFSSVTDPKGAKLIDHLNHPESIVTGVSNYVDPDIQFKFFKKVLPTLEKLGVIYNPGEANSVSLLQQMKVAAQNNGIEIIAAPANHSAEVALATHYLLSQVNALFINNDNTALSAFDSIVRISRTQKIPVFCSDNDMLEHGALATMGADQYEIGRQTGQIILQILEGKEVSELPVSFPNKTIELVNEKIKVEFRL